MPLYNVSGACDKSFESNNTPTDMEFYRQLYVQTISGFSSYHFLPFIFVLAFEFIAEYLDLNLRSQVKVWLSMDPPAIKTLDYPWFVYASIQWIFLLFTPL